jgi:hypothetical protein
MPVDAIRRLLREGLAGSIRRWREDRNGAALVQFIAILPLLILLMFGLYAVFQVMGARDTLCEATFEAARYLQVEGPHFPADDPTFEYPVGWENIATEIINQELASRTMVGLYPVERADVDIWPESVRRSPPDTLTVSREEVENNLFFIRATKAITNPLYGSLGGAIDISEDNGGMIRLTCRRSAFYEGPPVEPTLLSRGPSSPNRCPQPRALCRLCPGCTATPPPQDGTPTVCPDCRPR